MSPSRAHVEKHDGLWHTWVPIGGGFGVELAAWRTWREAYEQAARYMTLTGR